MDNHWPLVFFTLIIQMGLGLLFTFLISRPSITTILRRNFVKDDYLGKIEAEIVLISFLLISTGLMISFLHLGSPLRAIYSLSNISTSFLSREIIFVLLLWVLLGCYYFVIKKVNRVIVVNIFRIASVLTGVVLIYIMGRLYMIPAKPAWNTSITLINFFSSALITGSLLFFVLCSERYINGAMGITLKAFWVPFAVFQQAVTFKVLTTFKFHFVTYESLHGAVSVPTWVNVSYYSFLAAGVLLFFYFYRALKRADRVKLSGVASFTAILISEVISRYIFYTL